MHLSDLTSSDCSANACRQPARDVPNEVKSRLYLQAVDAAIFKWHYNPFCGQSMRELKHATFAELAGSAPLWVKSLLQ